MDENPVARLDQDIVQRIAFQRVAQIDAEDSGRAVWLSAKELRRV